MRTDEKSWKFTRVCLWNMFHKVAVETMHVPCKISNNRLYHVPRKGKILVETMSSNTKNSRNGHNKFFLRSQESKQVPTENH